MGRVLEVKSRQRDDQAVVRASVGERTRVKSYMSEAVTRTRQQQCMELSSDIVKTMTVTSDKANEMTTVSNNPFSSRSRDTCSTETKTHRTSPKSIVLRTRNRVRSRSLSPTVSTSSSLRTSATRHRRRSCPQMRRRSGFPEPETSDTSGTCDTSETRLRTRCAQDLSYKLKVNGIDDSTNTTRWITKVLSSLRSNDDPNGVVRGGVRMFNSTTPQSFHLQPCPRAQSCTQAPTTHTRVGAPTFPSSCLDGSVTLVGLGQYPQYTRAPFGEVAVGSSQSKRRRTSAWRVFDSCPPTSIVPLH